MGDCVIPAHLSDGHNGRVHAAYMVALSRSVKIKPHSGMNFSLCLNYKFQSDADFAVLSQ